LYYSRKMVGFQSRARYVKRAVDEILDNGQFTRDVLRYGSQLIRQMRTYPRCT
jgi:hypothetical protein